MLHKCTDIDIEYEVLCKDTMWRAWFFLEFMMT